MWNFPPPPTTVHHDLTLLACLARWRPPTSCTRAAGTPPSPPGTPSASPPRPTASPTTTTTRRSPANHGEHCSRKHPWLSLYPPWWSRHGVHHNVYRMMRTRSWWFCGEWHQHNLVFGARKWTKWRRGWCLQGARAATPPPASTGRTSRRAGCATCWRAAASPWRTGPGASRADPPAAPPRTPSPHRDIGAVFHLHCTIRVSFNKGVHIIIYFVN